MSNPLICPSANSAIQDSKCSLKTESAEYLSVRDCSRLIGVSERTIRGWIYKGLIHPIRIGPRLIRFKREYIEQWILQHKK